LEWEWGSDLDLDLDLVWGESVSHELRTPLHGILAAAELLGESDLTATQTSFLQTIQACGTSLVETVNHVLDFSKLSGNTKNGGLGNVIRRTSYVAISFFFFLDLVWIGTDGIANVCMYIGSIFLGCWKIRVRPP